MRVLSGLIVFACLTSCADQKQNEPQPENSASGPPGIHQRDREYVLIRDNLYYDRKGWGLYLKAVNNEDISNKHDVWLDDVNCDSCFAFNEDSWEYLKTLRDIVDTASFHHVMTDSAGGADIYEDTYNRYIHKWMSDGGTINASAK